MKFKKKKKSFKINHALELGTRSVERVSKKPSLYTMHCQVLITLVAVRNLIPQAANIEMRRCILHAHNGISVAEMSDTISDEVVSRWKVLVRYSL